MSETNEKRRKLVYPAEQILEKDLIDLKNESSTRRLNWSNELTENKDEYEHDFYPANQNCIAGKTKKTDLATFEAAKLMLATAIEEADNTNTEEQALVKKFEKEERDFVREFDDFRRKFKNTNKSQLEDNIKNKEGDVYEFVEDELRKQTEMKSTLLNTQANEIRGSVISYFQEELDEFFELANEAVFLYIKHHNLPNTIEGIVEAAEVAARANDDRQQIEAKIEQQMESLAESVHHGLRDQERALRSELTQIQSDIVEGKSTETLEKEITEIRDNVENIATQRQRDVRTIENKVKELETLKTELTGKIEELDTAREEVVSELKDETKQQAGRMIEQEIEGMKKQKSKLAREVQRLQTERERMETAGERIDKEYSSLEERIESTEERVEKGQADIENRLEELSQSVPTGNNEQSDGKAIRAKLARLYEQDYIGRFDTSVREANTITLPDGDQFTVSEGYWKDRRRSQSGNHRAVVEEILDNSAENINKYPLGSYSIYRVIESRFAGLTSTTELVIQAIVKANLEAFAHNGFDARPAGVDDLLDVINETLCWNEVEDTPHLIGIASPTGWTKEVVDLVSNQDSARSRFSEDVSICLIDIQENDLIYDSHDKLVSENIGLFEREVDSERVSHCVDTIQTEYVNDPMEKIIPHYEIVEEYEFHPHIVRKAFDHFVENGSARKEYREELQGLCLFLD